MANFDPVEASNSDIRAVARVAQICSLFGSHVQELTAADVADQTGLNRTTAYRYCASMVAAGLLERGSRRGTFALGALMLELGVRALGRQRVVEIAGPPLRALSESVRLTAVLSLRGMQGPVVALVEEDTSRTVVVTVHVGTRLDSAAAQTHVYLAHADDAARHQYMNALPLSEREPVEAAVADVRRDGYSLVRHAGGSFAIAVPVYDESGMCATLGVLGAGELDALDVVVARLQATATDLSRELGAAYSP
jgi:DNA-binding IclR family transcriptional regulator